jgi:hypothetical protein
MNRACGNCGRPSEADWCAECEALLPALPDDRTSDGYAAWLEALARAESEDSLFETLAGKRPPTSKLAKQQVRGRLIKLLGQKFSELDCGASPAKTADAWLSEGGGAGDAVQGRAFVAEDVQPWDASVNGASVLDEVANLIDEYVYISPEGRERLRPLGRVYARL